MEEIILDVIPINKNETFPTKNEWFHFAKKKEENIPEVAILDRMIQQISNMFYECDCIIILEKGKVTEIFNKAKGEIK